MQAENTVISQDKQSDNQARRHSQPARQIDTQAGQQEMNSINVETHA